jgi:hypothetical protein
MTFYGGFLPLRSTAVAAPMLAPTDMYMLSQASEISEPADIAFLSTKAVGVSPWRE